MLCLLIGSEQFMQLKCINNNATQSIAGSLQVDLNKKQTKKHKPITFELSQEIQLKLLFFVISFPGLIQLMKWCLYVRITRSKQKIHIWFSLSIHQFFWNLRKVSFFGITYPQALNVCCDNQKYQIPLNYFLTSTRDL